MTKLEIALSNMKSGNGKNLDISKIARLSCSFRFSNRNIFELLAWECIKGSKTFTIELPIEYYEEIVVEIPKVKIVAAEAVDIFKKGVDGESRRTSW